MPTPNTQLLTAAAAAARAGVTTQAIYLNAARREGDPKRLNPSPASPHHSRLFDPAEVDRWTAARAAAAAEPSERKYITYGLTPKHEAILDELKTLGGHRSRQACLDALLENAHIIHRVADQIENGHTA